MGGFHGVQTAAGALPATVRAGGGKGRQRQETCNNGEPSGLHSASGTLPKLFFLAGDAGQKKHKMRKAA